ncbi:GREB1-related protein [Dysgonomonas macrotermitis]|uniref:TET-Associated Glycosyltransferase domain-containing protein n=1 Tax=Dysgonomonas macrotermitis TaxID=1346286 RepID=A0A1M5C432_9BACT|nr:hypothetical protein [Dysgonomonas macrotermitis]SHF49455.1 hypothetical protein SAMN05444362_10722 [Dysgonomonas macrotermitis]
MKNKDFAVFILTHGRPNKVHTYNSLRKCGYTGRIFIIIDNEDTQAEVYKQTYGEQVIVFDKKAVSDTFDEGDNFEDRRAIVYARNACFDIANNLGIKYFMQCDDDYTAFSYKFNSKGKYTHKAIKDLDVIFDAMLDYYIAIDIKSIAMSQNGDFIGGENGSFGKSRKLFRKCMNTFICSTDRPFQFIGRINEDVNTYTNVQSRGNVFLTLSNIAINQLTTQSNSGGMTELYLDSGTYIKSFYTVIYSPSCCRILPMGETHRRLHHRITWKNAVPVIINESYKK